MRVVYKAHNEKLNRVIALKFENSARTILMRGWNFENPDAVCRHLELLA